MKIVCLLSGGIDSSVMLFKLKRNGHELRPLFINYGQKSMMREFKAATDICNMLNLILEKIDVSGLSCIPSGLTDQNCSSVDDPIFPARNIIFLSIAASFAASKSIDTIGIGVQKTSNFPDQTEDFLDLTELALSSATGKKLKIFAPLSTLNKLEIIRLAEENNIPLDFTYSCYEGSEIPCGKCLSCKDRQNAFRLQNFRNT